MFIFNATDISALEKLLLDNEGNLQVVEYKQLKPFTQEQISQFCVKHGVYQIVTRELVDFLKGFIGSAEAIEIGAGNGCLGLALGIPTTDNRMQEWPDIITLYNSLRQAPVRYGRWVEPLDALTAVLKYKPDVVIGAWITHRWKPHLPNGNIHGVDELQFRGKIKNYIMIGHERVHKDKEIFGVFRCTTLKFDWLVSRSLDKDKNRIYIFECL